MAVSERIHVAPHTHLLAGSAVAVSSIFCGMVASGSAASVKYVLYVSM